MYISTYIFGIRIEILWNIISGGDGPYEECVAPMVDMITFNYKPLNIKETKSPEELFMDAYTEEVFDL